MRYIKKNNHIISGNFMVAQVKKRAKNKRTVARLVNDNLPLVKWFLGRFFGKIEEGSHLWEDYYSAALEGLHLAARKYDDKRNSTFSAFAVLLMRQSVVLWHRKSSKSGFIRVARTQTPVIVHTESLIDTYGVECDDDHTRALDVQDRLQAVQRIIQSMSAPHRQVCEHLYFGKKLSKRRLEELAEQYDYLSAKSLLMCAKRRLRERTLHLRDDYDDTIADDE
jgi:RNA polymerase sigma factor (sigma-70 family)